MEGDGVRLRGRSRLRTRMLKFTHGGCSDCDRLSAMMEGSDCDRLGEDDETNIEEGGRVV